MKNYLIAAFFLMSAATPAWAEPAWNASLSVSEEYNDNTKEERHGKGDFVTTLRPGLSYRYEGSRSLLETNYRGKWNHYASGSRDLEFNHDAMLHGLLDVWEGFFFLDVRDTYRLVNADRTRGEALEEDSAVDQMQQNIFTFSPYITPRFGERGQAKVGYAFSNIWYDEDDRDSKNIHRGFVDAQYELSGRTALLTGGSHTQEIWEDETLDRDIFYLGARHAYAEKGVAYLKAGPQRTRYRDRDTSSSSLFWDAGLDHDFGAVLLHLNTGVSFEDDPDTGEAYERRFGTLRLSKLWPRTTVSVSTTLEEYEDRSEKAKDGEKVLRTALGLKLSHELSSRLTASLGLIHDFQNRSDDDTRRWYANVGLEYALSERLRLGCWYRFKDSSSDDEEESYRVNRVGVQLTMTF
jgi:opacity protein-like surface antigen